MVKRKTPAGKSTASPKKQKSVQAHAYQRQSTLVAGLREENDEEGLPEEQGMELRPHHRTDEHYTKKASKKTTPKTMKKAMPKSKKKSTPRKTATPTPKKRAHIVKAAAMKPTPPVAKESSPPLLLVSIILVVLLVAATMLGGAAKLNLLAYDADSDGDVDIAELSKAIAVSCDKSNAQICIKDCWVTMNPQDKAKSDTKVANAIVVAFDTDNDGDLDGEDLARATDKLTALATTTVITLLVHDHDNDGDVDVAELTKTIGQHCDAESQTCLKNIWFATHPEDKAAKLDDAAVATKIVAEFDADKDGDLDGAELRRANAQFNVRFDKHGNLAHSRWVVDWVDLLAHDDNNDKKVDASELTASIVKHCGEMTKTAVSNKKCLRELWTSQHPKDASLGDADVAAAIVAAFDADGDGDIEGDELQRANAKINARA